jgi:hypothetical protein
MSYQRSLGGSVAQGLMSRAFSARFYRIYPWGGCTRLELNSAVGANGTAAIERQTARLHISLGLQLRHRLQNAPTTIESSFQRTPGCFLSACLGRLPRLKLNSAVGANGTAAIERQRRDSYQPRATPEGRMQIHVPSAEGAIQAVESVPRKMQR